MKSSSIQKAVMRRVYFHYVLGIFTHSMFRRGVFLGAAALLLAKWLHVASIINNFLSLPVRNVPNYVYGSVQSAVTHGELLTVLTLVLALVVAISTVFKLLRTFKFGGWRVVGV